MCFNEYVLVFLWVDIFGLLVIYHLLLQCPMCAWLVCFIMGGLVCLRCECVVVIHIRVISVFYNGMMSTGECVKL